MENLCILYLFSTIIILFKFITKHHFTKPDLYDIIYLKDSKKTSYIRKGRVMKDGSNI